MFGSNEKNGDSSSTEEVETGSVDDDSSGRVSSGTMIPVTPPQTSIKR